MISPRYAIRAPHEPLYLHSFLYYLHLILGKSDSVIYNPLARDLQIGRMELEMVSRPGRGVGRMIR